MNPKNKLGDGAFGDVYKLKNKFSDKEFAVKLCNKKMK